MISRHLPHEIYQLAATYTLGEPIRVYRTTKRPQFKVYGWSIAFTSVICIIAAGTQIPFRFTQTSLTLYGILVAIMLFVAIMFFGSLLLLRRATVYICSAGFIFHHKSMDKIVRWEDIEWVSSNKERCIVYLTNKEQVILGQLIDHLETLAQEIELKARLIKRPEGRETLELQFEHLVSHQAVREQEKYDHVQKKKRLIENETPEEALTLREEYRLGGVVATYHGGFKGILRRKAVGLPIHYLLLLAFPSLFIEGFFHFRFLPSFLASNTSPLFWVLFVLSFLFMPRFYARFLRLHLYTDGFVYIEGGSFEAVRWEQIEKIIYHKSMPAFLLPFCHIYLTNGDTLVISGYIHERSAVKQAFDEHVVNKVQIS